VSNERAVRNYCKGGKLPAGMMLSFRQKPNGQQSPPEVIATESNLVPPWLLARAAKGASN